MTFFEYLRDPNPHPWLDLSKYTMWQIVMFLIGLVLWLVAYLDTIICAFKKKTMNIPVGCVITNYGWEISTSFFFLPDMGKLLVFGYWAWMIFDTFIFYNTLKYGYKQCQTEYFKKHIKAFIIIGIIVSFATQCTYMVCGFDIPLAPISGDIINLYMSVAFIYLLTIPGYEGNSAITGWTKFLGTGIINVMFALKYPHNYFLIAIGVSCAIFDVIYIVLLHRKKGNAVLA